MVRESKCRFAPGAGFSLWLLVATSCSTAVVNWYGTRRVPGYVVPTKIPLVVDVSERAHEADQGGYVDTMVLTVFEELGDRGIQSTIVTPKSSRLPNPRVEIIVGTFDDGDFGEAYLSQVAVNAPLAAAGVPIGVMPFAGSSALAVVIRAYSPSNQLMFEGVIKGADFGTANPRDLAETAGDAIAEALTNPDATRPAPPQRTY